MGKFDLLDIPKKKKDEINIEVTFELDEDSILTVNAVIKENNCNNSIVIKNDKGGLSKNEILNAKIKQENEKIGENLGPAMTIERNYKKEINKYINLINNSFKQIEQLYYLNKLGKIVENFISTFDKNVLDNYTFKEKMHFYLNILFNAYSVMLNYDILLSLEEKENIISKISEYLKFFEKKGTTYCPSLVQIFYNNNDEIFGEFFIQILGFYSQKGTELYAANEKKYAKHYLEEALSINKKFSVEERVKNNSELFGRLYSIIDNCKELINILKAESIEKYCVSFSIHNLIKEEEYSDKEQILDILDRFKDALRLLENPKKKADILLKAIYLANIIKIEYKIFNSNSYDTLLKMIENCIELKLQIPKGCSSPKLEWFEEICIYKLEIEEKIMKLKDNPKEEEIIIKKELTNVFEEINTKFQEGKIPFFIFILSKYKPNGLEDNMNFDDEVDLEYAYNSDRKGFLKKLRKLYNPMRYRGEKREDQISHSIMQEIAIKLNSLN